MVWFFPSPHPQIFFHVSDLQFSTLTQVTSPEDIIRIHTVAAEVLNYVQSALVILKSCNISSCHILSEDTMLHFWISVLRLAKLYLSFTVYGEQIECVRAALVIVSTTATDCTCGDKAKTLYKVSDIKNLLCFILDHLVSQKKGIKSTFF